MNQAKIIASLDIDLSYINDDTVAPLMLFSGAKSIQEVKENYLRAIMTELENVIKRYENTVVYNIGGDFVGEQSESIDNEMMPDIQAPIPYDYPQEMDIIDNLLDEDTDSKNMFEYDTSEYYSAVADIIQKDIQLVSNDHGIIQTVLVNPVYFDKLSDYEIIERADDDEYWFKMSVPAKPFESANIYQIEYFGYDDKEDLQYYQGLDANEINKIIEER